MGCLARILLGKAACIAHVVPCETLIGTAAWAYESTTFPQAVLGPGVLKTNDDRELLSRCPKVRHPPQNRSKVIRFASNEAPPPRGLAHRLPVHGAHAARVPRHPFGPGRHGPLRGPP